MMSTDAADAQGAEQKCAGCGIAEIDINLDSCNNCDVRYCSVECQRDNISQHLSVCQKQRVAAVVFPKELRDEILFKQPESSHLGDCPICCFPLSLDLAKSSMASCCCKLLCNGCNYANQQRELEQGLQRKCLFCRHPLRTDVKKNYMKRAEANDPVAMTQLGLMLIDKGEYEEAFEYFTKAIELGNMDAHCGLALLYEKGNGAEMDKRKELFHLEEAAIGGHAESRCQLGKYEGANRSYDRAIKHFIIAANMGHDESLGLLKKQYAKGYVAKEEFASALRAHHAAVKATKSPQREEAVAARPLLKDAAWWQK